MVESISKVMAIKNAKEGLIFAGVLFGTAALTYMSTKKTVIREGKRRVKNQCRTVVKRECLEIPVVGTDEFCAEKMDEICDI